jgi:hypothetical protein
MPTESLEVQIRHLEERLLAPEVRGSGHELDVLLAPDFIEFGSSGRTFDKADVIRYLEKEGPVEGTIEKFAVTELGPDVVLATYRIVSRSRSGAGGPRASLRSSIWVRKDGGWQLRFHQGTSIPK